MRIEPHQEAEDAIIVIDAGGRLRLIKGTATTDQLLADRNGLAVHVHAQGAHPLVELAGTLTGATAASVDDILDWVSGQTTQQLNVDMAQVHTVDVNGLAVIDESRVRRRARIVRPSDAATQLRSLVATAA